MSGYMRFLPWVALLAGVAAFLAVSMPPASPENEMQIYEFAKLPVVADGRVKPLDTLARVNLMIISHRQEYVDAADKRHPAIGWLLEVMASPYRDPAGEEKERTFLIQDSEVVNHLELPARSDSRYSLEDLKPQSEKLFPVAQRALQQDPAQRTPLDRGLLAVAQQIRLYVQLGRTAWNMPIFRIENDQLVATLGLQRRSGLRYALGEFAPHYSEFATEVDQLEKKDSKDQDAYEKSVVQLGHSVQILLTLSEYQNLRAIPPATAGGEWQLLGDHPKSEAGTRWRAMLAGYLKNDPSAFNRGLGDYQTWLERQPTQGAEKCDLETLFNNAAPFYWCAVVYAVVFLLVCCSWLGYREPLAQSAFYLALVTLVVHTLALLARMYIQGRPPVTNLYSSAVFIGWGGVVLGLALEAAFRGGLGTLLASMIGGLTMLVAHHLAETGGDTMEMMRAVLDTNFWLATHVTCVTFGYTATFAAAALGMVYILGGLFTRGLDQPTSRSTLVTGGDEGLTPATRRTIEQPLHKTLGQMIYAVVCFAMFFSFIGTVLGGIWADQSWGRFWGWDPKENGALLIVLVNAIVLHARWGGVVKMRGMAVLTVAGAMVTVWSWFGTNQLGVGLHAYGFNDTLVKVCNGVWLFCLVVTCLGLVPLKYWRSKFVSVAVGTPTPAAGDLERPRPKPRPGLGHA